MAFSKTLIDLVNTWGGEVWHGGVQKLDTFNPTYDGVIEIRPKAGLRLILNSNSSLATFKTGSRIQNADAGSTEDKALFAI
ncbi:hypothetical protein, partial [Enterobacter hormaechei]